MAGPLSVCTKEEQHAVIQFLWAEGVPGAEIHRRLSAQYGNSALLQSSVYEGTAMFKNGRTGVTDDERSRRPSTSTREENTEQVHAMILDNRQVTTDEVAYHLLISHGSVHEIIPNRLGFHKVCARWVPKKLTEEHKCNRLTICRILLNCCHQEGDAFLRCIITGDKTWIYHYVPESKRQSLEWKHPTPPPQKKKVQNLTAAGKVMLTGFWDSQGPILEHYQERGTTVNSAHYSEMLRDKLKPAIRTKC
jgi:histone-lysine N-methyltransferase SETMAR